MNHAQDRLIVQVRQFVMDHTSDEWRAFEPDLYQAFDTFNDRHFFRSLPPTWIKIGFCGYRTLGLYSHRGDHGIRGEICISERLIHGNQRGVLVLDQNAPGFKRYLHDILLHEMVHAYCGQVLARSERGWHGHGPMFARECNRIGKSLGLPLVRQALLRKDAERNKPNCKYWPSCVRGADFYGDAVVESGS